MNFEYCLQHYTKKPLDKISSKIYDTVKLLFTNLIDIKRSSGALPAAIETAKAQISLFRQISSIRKSVEIDHDLISAIRVLINLYQDHLENKGNISAQARQVLFKKIKDLEQEQLQVLERDLKNNKGTYIDTCISVGHLCVKLNLPNEAVDHL